MAALVLLGVGIVGSPAHARTRTQEDDALDALIAVESEVAALVRLGAFPGQVPQRLLDVEADWRTELEGMTRKELVDWLRNSETEGLVYLERLGAANLSPDSNAALRRLPPDSVTAVESQQPIKVPAQVYERALNDLEYRNGAGPGGTTGPAGSTPADAAGPDAQGTDTSGADQQPADQQPADQQPADQQPAAQQPADQQPSGTDRHLGVILGLAGGLLLAAALAATLLMRRRRAARPTGIEGSVAGLLDAGRRLSASVDAVEIHDILVREAAALTGAANAALVTLDSAPASQPVVVAETADGVVDGSALGRGVIRRVLDTGVGLRSVVDDPAIAEAPRATVIVPLVRSGAIAGVVVVTRPPERPFGPEALDLLGQLVPMAAAALVSAGLHDNVAELSLTDGLTELGNRRRLDRDLAAALGAGAGTVGFVMVDIDHFKQFNDTHGHVAGDGVLQGVAALLRDNVRGDDVVYRYGGEEFCVLLPDATADDAAEVSERLRRAVEEHDFAGGELQPGGRLTISVGTTVASRTDPVAIKERADHALYEAKHRGRNQVVVDGAPPA